MPDSNCTNQSVALLTRHDKAPLVAPSLASVGLQVVTTDRFDTDSLGTFSGEIERSLSPLDCARRKARLACELTGMELGLGSEGSFGGGPLPGLMNWDDEILVLHNAASNQEIVAFARGAISLTWIEETSLPRIREHLDHHGPQQGWIFRHNDQVFKGILGADKLLSELSRLQLIEGDTLRIQLRIEPDLRAHYCPERQVYIRQAAEQLAQRLQSLCPECGCANFWEHETERGLPCAWCRQPTRLPQALIWQCPTCSYRDHRPVATETADPGSCDWCNP